MNIIEDVKLDFSDVLIVPSRHTKKIYSRSQVILERHFDFSYGLFPTPPPPSVLTVPVFASNMASIGTFLVAEVLSKHKMVTVLHKYHTVLDFIKYADDNIGTHKSVFDYCAVSCGNSEADFERLTDIMRTYSENIRYICLDVANGYQSQFMDMVSRVRAEYPRHIIIAGNVVTVDGARDLINAGADVIKVGIGNGSACTTRIKTGVGYPQLSAIIEISEMTRNRGVYLLSDGGCTCPGDIAKAFAAGADIVMVGGMFAGTNETGTKFFGMSSEYAMDKFNDGKNSYRTSEGREVDVQPKGPLDHVVLDILGGLRSTCTYVGVTNLSEIQDRAQFIRVNNQFNRMYV